MVRWLRWHRIRNSSPGGLRPSTLPLGHGGSPQYWLHVLLVHGMSQHCLVVPCFYSPRLTSDVSYAPSRLSTTQCWLNAVQVLAQCRASAGPAYRVFTHLGWRKTCHTLRHASQPHSAGSMPGECWPGIPCFTYLGWRQTCHTLRHASQPRSDMSRCPPSPRGRCTNHRLQSSSWVHNIPDKCIYNVDPLLAQYWTGSHTMDQNWVDNESMSMIVCGVSTADVIYTYEISD